LGEIHTKTVLRGERVSYQVCIKADRFINAAVSVESDLDAEIKLYLVKNAYMDLPCKESHMENEDYITLEPGWMPDILVPMGEQNYKCTLSDQYTSIWVKTDIPKDVVPGKYSIKVKITPENAGAVDGTLFEIQKIMKVHVSSAVMPEQKLLYTRWFHADCIAVQHHVDIYSEEHWALIDKYIAAAADVGVNMILVPTHTPPLDTAVGTTRPCVQLVDIEKIGDKYIFSFEKFRRFIGICKKNGIRYFEIAHMFSQWGAKYAVNIKVTENGKTDYMFGWHVAADSPEYIAFLKQYIAAVSKELEREGISQNTYFHISDEPELKDMDTYITASQIIRPLIGDSKTFDAISHYTYCEKGLVRCPVTYMENIHEFLEHKLENQWVYYGCAPEKVFPNAFLAMPSYRVRVLGFLLYKYNLQGFLHWGFNFYHSQLSRYPINPYVTTSSDKAFPSGDPFIVYPARDGVYPSIRGEVTYEGIQDMDICFALETYIGREAVVEMIDAAAGMDLRFDNFPKNKEFLEELRTAMVKKIEDSVA